MTRQRDQDRAAWHEQAHAQYLSADAATKGNLLKPHLYAQPGVSDWPGLWHGNEATARSRASEEMNSYWDEHPRITKTGFSAAARSERDAEYDDWMDRQERNPSPHLHPAQFGFLD